mgnify:FL=1
MWLLGPLRWLFWPLVASHVLAFALGRMLGRGRGPVAHYHVQGGPPPSRRRSPDDVIAAVLRLILLAAAVFLMYKVGWFDGSSDRQESSQ